MHTKGPLAGIRILDFSRALAGPFSAQILGDLGADVIKIEHPTRSDDARTWPPFYNERATYYLTANRNKRCLTLDTTNPSSSKILRRLVSTADVAVENYRPGIAEKIGIGYEQLRRLNPKVILCSIRGYGRGPYEDRPAYDAAMQAYTGLMSVTGDPDGEVARVGTAIVDLSTSLYAAIGILGALRNVDIDGQGVHLEVSLRDAGLAMMSYQLNTYLNAGIMIQRSGTAHAAMAPTKVFHTASDDVLLMAGNQEQWQRLAVALGHPEWCNDPDFTTNAKRVEYRSKLHSKLQEILRTRPLSEWLPIFETADLPHTPVRTVAEVADDQATQEFMVETIASRFGDVQLVKSPILYDRESLPLRRPPPDHGEHTDEILSELGLTDREIRELKKAGAV